MEPNLDMRSHGVFNVHFPRVCVCVRVRASVPRRRTARSWSEHTFICS